MPPDPTPFASTRLMLETASRAVGLIDRDGIRGLTRVSVEEIGAMACALVHLGLVPTPPNQAPPETLIKPTLKD